MPWKASRPTLLKKRNSAPSPTSWKNTRSSAGRLAASPAARTEPLTCALTRFGNTFDRTAGNRLKRSTAQHVDKLARRSAPLTLAPFHSSCRLSPRWQQSLLLKGAYARVGGDDETAARIIGVSLGSARLAKKRHLSPAARYHA